MTVLVYSKPGCVQCDATCREFDRLGVPYRKITPADDPFMLDRLRAGGHRALPVVEVPGIDTWAGFRPDLIAAEAKRHARRRALDDLIEMSAPFLDLPNEQDPSK